MKRRWGILLALALAVSLGFSGLAIAAGGLFPDQARVQITEAGFAPQFVTVTVGGVVTWTNAGTRTHSILSTDYFFFSGVLSPSQSFSYVFPISGTFPYSDSLGTATGKVFVVEKRHYLFLPLTLKSR